MSGNCTASDETLKYLIACQDDGSCFNLHSLADSLIIASYLNWGLLGILSLQVYNYYSHFRDDVKHIKIIVYAVFAVELAQTAIVSQNVFAALASGHGSPAQINDARLYWLTIPLVGGIVGTIGQIYFALRMWRMSAGGGSKVAPVIVSILAAASLAASLAAVISFHKEKTFCDLLSGSLTNVPFVAWNGIGAICDIVISLTMPYYLMRQSSGYHSTHVIVVRLVALIIETGVLTSIVVITHLSLLASHQVGFIIPGVSMSKVYAITMLVLLNRRRDDRERMDQSRRFRSTSTSSGPPASPNHVVEHEPTYRGGGNIRVRSDALVVTLPPRASIGTPLAPYSGSDGSNYTATGGRSNYNAEDSNQTVDGSNYSHSEDRRTFNRGGSNAHLLSS